ncbi:MAG: T9SS type A sorting domain-containing protein, partial [Ignavibacteriaceae bacterium]|nr:T9SS type A sorting domain-containing protein [Ignavibacteriaceae bacterium]
MKTKLLLILLLITVNIYAQSYGGGSGTISDPYLIGMPAHLAELATTVNGGTNYYGNYFVMTADINLSSYANWTPIGTNSTYPFKGKFNGNNYTISNLTVTTGPGLFGEIQAGAEIKNLTISNCNINNTSVATNIGALVGRVYLAVANESIKITNVHVSGIVIGYSDRWVGGLAGLVHLTSSATGDDTYNIFISDCSANLNVNADYNYTSYGTTRGGLIGGSSGYSNKLVRINNCSSTGSITDNRSMVTTENIIGGIVGRSYTTRFKDCYSTLNITSTFESNYIGGFAADAKEGTEIINSYSTGIITATGYFIAGFLGNYDNSINSFSNCFWDTEVSTKSDGTGGSWSNPAGITGKTTAQMKTQSTFTDAGWDFTNIWHYTSGNYPTLISSSFTEPTTQATNISFGNVNPDQMTVSWTRGNGEFVTVFAKAASSGTAVPVDRTSYTANNVFGSGTQIGSTGWYCVYSGTGTEVNVTGLSENTSYIFQAFDFNGEGWYDQNYLTSPGTDNPDVQATPLLQTPTTQAHTLVFSTLGSTSFTLGWTNGNGSKRAVFVKQANTGEALPVNNTTYTASTGFGGGTEIGSTGWYCVYNGTGNGISITGLTKNTEYIAQVFEYNGSAGSEKYLTTISTDNPKTTTTLNYSNNALSFDGVNDYVLVGNNTSNSIMTIEAWIKPNELKSREMEIVGFGGNNEVYEFRLESTTGKLQFGIYDNSVWNALTTDDAIQLNTWTHVAVVKNGTNIFLYINGSQVKSGTLNGTPTISITSIGNLKTEGTLYSYYFPGKIDEVRIWNDVRDITEISQNMYNELVGNEAGLVAYYNMNDGSGTTLNDNATAGTYDCTFYEGENPGAGPTWTTDAAPLGAPVTQANNITFTNVDASSATVGWTNGTGTKRVAFAKQGSSGTTAPINGTTYTASTNLGSGTQIGSTGWFCVYNGTGSSESISGLSPNTSYLFQVFEYNGNAGGEQYLTESATDNPKSVNTLEYTPNYIPNYALDFNGTDEYVGIGASSYDNTTFSVEAWINPTTNSGRNRVIVSWAKDGSNIVEFRINGEGGSANGKLELGVWNGSSWQPVTSSSQISLNSWSHVAAVKYGTSVYLYVNGVQVGTGVINITVTVTISTIGNLNKEGEVGASNFGGQIDEVRIWNTNRSVTQIRDNMCKTLAGTESNLVGYYKMSDGTGTTVTDNSTNDNHGTFANMDNTNWVTSGAPIGNVSVNNYSSPVSVNLASPFGDNVTVGSLTGSPTGVQIYRINSEPNVTTPPGNLTQISPMYYFGVMIVGGTSPTYTFTYNYDGHPGITDETKLDLASRANNSSVTWTETNALLNTTEKTLTLTGQTGTEYILGTKSNNPLPVELTSFAASVNKNKVVLNWQTATEVDNYGFEIERTPHIPPFDKGGTEGGWEKVGFVEGYGNSNSTKEYSFVDESVSGGKYSYRLKQIDNDGKYSYSSEVEVEIENIPTEYTLYQNYPNPFNPSTTIKFGLPKDSKVVLEVFNIIGEKVTTLINQEMSAGYHNIIFSANELSTGIYIYKITANEF